MQYQTEVIACRIRKELKEDLRAMSLNLQIHQSELLRGLIVAYINENRGLGSEEVPAYSQSPHASSWESSY
jgi:hypothetical protein